MAKSTNHPTLEQQAVLRFDKNKRSLKGHVSYLSTGVSLYLSAADTQARYS